MTETQVLQVEKGGNKRNDYLISQNTFNLAIYTMVDEQ